MAAEYGGSIRWVEDFMDRGWEEASSDGVDDAGGDEGGGGGLEWR